MNKLSALGCKVLLVSSFGLALSSQSASAELSANFGWVSDYIYRGIPQDDSSAYIGVDYESSGFYVGSWAADVGKGAEVDFYLGYNGSIGEDVSYGAGATVYLYTDDFDDTYKELNFSAGYRMATLDLAVGNFENFDGPTEDYTFVSLTVEHNGLYAKVGSFSQDFDGDYFEAGYGLEVSGFDVSVSFVHSNSDLVEGGDNSIVFGLGKSFDLGKVIAHAARKNN